MELILYPPPTFPSLYFKDGTQSTYQIYLFTYIHFLITCIKHGCSLRNKHDLKHLRRLT